jgi:hypothetical protein
MFFADRMLMDAPRRSAEGYMGVHAKSARSGVYQYLGRELDPEGKNFQADHVVNVYRSPEEVFDGKALGSFVAKPITDDHPLNPVNAGNWRDLARGTIMGAVKDGDYVGFDLAFLDAGIVDAIESGKKELSCGYSSQIVVGDGVAPDGTAFQARQVGIRGNHLALVETGRAGSTCRVNDSATCEPMPSDEVRKLLADERTYSGSPNPHKTGSANSGGRQVSDTKTITRDGFSIVVTDQAETYIGKLEDSAKQLTDKLVAADTKVGELTAAVSTKDGEIAALTQKVKDAEVSPAQLEKLVADRSALIAQAKAIDPNIVTDGKTEGEIRKAVVSAKLGDAAKDMNDGAIGGAFAVLAKDVKVDPIRNVMSNAAPTNIGDAKGDYLAARDLARKNLSDGWKTPAANAA